jgi:hypothetical protein
MKKWEQIALSSFWPMVNDGICKLPVVKIEMHGLRPLIELLLDDDKAQSQWRRKKLSPLAKRNLTLRISLSSIRS